MKPLLLPSILMLNLLSTAFSALNITIHSSPLSCPADSALYTYNSLSRCCPGSLVAYGDPEIAYCCVDGSMALEPVSFCPGFPFCSPTTFVTPATRTQTSLTAGASESCRAKVEFGASDYSSRVSAAMSGTAGGSAKPSTGSTGGGSTSFSGAAVTGAPASGLLGGMLGVVGFLQKKVGG